MAGRAGRDHSKKASVTFIVDTKDSGRWHDLIHDKPLEIKSSFEDVGVLAKYLLRDIVKYEMSSLGDVTNWQSRCFNDKIPVMKALLLLEELKAIEMSESTFKVKDFGFISVKYGFHPENISRWAENFTELFSKGNENSESAIAVTLANVVYERFNGYAGKDHLEVFSEFKSSLPKDMEAEDCLNAAVVWWYALGGPPIGNLRPLAADLKKDADRYVGALQALNRACSWNQSSFFESLRTMLQKRVGFDKVWLCSLEGMTKARAEFLISVGVKDWDTLKSSLSQIDEEDEDFRRCVINALRQIR